MKLPQTDATGKIGLDLGAQRYDPHLIYVHRFGKLNQIQV